MDAIKLAVEVPVAVAVRAGTGRAGRTSVALSPEVLGALAPELRDVLAGALRPEPPKDGRATGAHLLALGDRAYEQALTLPTADASAGPVAEALRAALERELAERTELARQVDADPAGQIDHRAGHDPGERWVLRHDSPAHRLSVRQKDHPALAALRAELRRRDAADVAEWRATFLAAAPESLVQENSYAPSGADRFSAGGLPRALERDEAVRAHSRAVGDAARMRQHQWAQKAKDREAAEEAKREAAKRDLARGVEADREAILAYARDACEDSPASPWHDVVLLAEEGYDPMTRAAELFHEQLQCDVSLGAGVGSTSMMTVDGTKTDVWTSEPRKNPRPEAVKMARAIREAVAKAPLPSRGVTVTVLPVQRVTEGEDEERGNQGTRYTAVCVEICVTGAARRWIVVNAE